MNDDGTRRSRMGWIASVFHPERKIASPTLVAIKAMLSGRRATPSMPTVEVPAATFSFGRSSAPLEVSLDSVPNLEAVGGIAKLAVESGETVGIARVGRNSFVGYKLEDDVLREIEVELDEASGKLRIAAVETYPLPPAS
jgi:hypothetical protein